MKSSIKIVKRKRAEHADDMNSSEGEKSVEQSTREMVSTVKSWIAELHERKRTQRHSLSELVSLPVSG